MLRLKMVRLGRAVTLGVREKGAWTMSARIESSELGGVDRGWASRGEQGSLVTKVLRARRKLPSRYRRLVPASPLSRGTGGAVKWLGAQEDS